MSLTDGRRFRGVCRVHFALAYKYADGLEYSAYVGPQFYVIENGVRRKKHSAPVVWRLVYITDEHGRYKHASRDVRRQHGEVLFGYDAGRYVVAQGDQWWHVVEDDDAMQRLHALLRDATTKGAA